MANELQTKLDAILLDKNANLLPENLKKDVTCLGITGTLEKGVKVFKNINEMNSYTGSVEGDVSVVYGQSYERFTSDSKTTSLYFNEIVTLNTKQTEDKSIRFFGILDDNYLDGNAYITTTSFDFHAYTNTVDCRVKYSSKDGVTYTRTSISGADETDTNKITLDVPIQFMGDVEPYDSVFGEFIKIPVMFFGGIFNYIKNTSNELEWVFAPNQFNATNEWVYKKNFFGMDGASIGTLFESVSNSLNDSNASACNDMIAIYSHMEPIIVTDEDVSSYKYRWVNSIPIKYDGTPVLDTSNLTSMVNFLNQNRMIKYIPKFNTSNVTNMSEAFSINPELLYVADGMDMSNCTSLSYVLHSCVQLKNAPSFLNTNNVTNFGGAFQWCDELIYVPVYDMSSCTSASSFVGDCPKLSDDSLNNIMQSCISATKMQTKTLKHLGLTSAQATRCQSLSNYQTFTAAGWTTGY